MWPHEFVTVKVNHVCGIFRNPYVGFPCDILCKAGKGVHIGKCRYIHLVGGDRDKQVLKLDIPFSVNRTV